MYNSYMLKEKLNEMGSHEKCPIVILMRDRKILTGHRHYSKEKWKDVSVWTYPGGRCDAGETLEQTVRRETQEEVGITKFEITDFISEVPGAKEGDIVSVFFGVTEEDAKLMEPDKFSEWRWVSMEEYIVNKQYGFNPHARQAIIDFLKVRFKM
jgi:ADP-ribose pyrophosphatase YjhB (NUDIX family)